MLPVKSIMTKEVIYVKPNTPIYEAMQLLPQHQISGMPVVDDEMNLIGILTEKDVLKLLIEDVSYNKTTVADFMQTDVVSFTEDDSAVKVCKFFQDNFIRRVPIVRQGKLVGIVSRRDIISLILEYKNKTMYRFS